MNAQSNQPFSEIIESMDKRNHFVRVGRTIYSVVGKAYHVKSISRVLNAESYKTSETIPVTEDEKQKKPWLMKAIDSELYLVSDLLQLNGFLKNEQKRIKRLGH